MNNALLSRATVLVLKPLEEAAIEKIIRRALSIEKKWPSHSVRFISVSNLQEGKGIDLNLQALSRLKARGWSDWTYTIVGEGVERKRLKRLVCHLNFNEQVFFAGACPHRQVYDYLQNADVFILPSYREAFGIAYLEAMSCGLLTIGVVGEGPECFIENTKTGFLVPPKDIDALANTLEQVFLSREQIQKIASNGKQYVHQNLTWHAHAKQLLSVYLNIKAE